MNDMSCPLSERKCVPCEGEVPLIPEEKAKELLAGLVGWELESGTTIKKQYTFKGFKGSMKFVNDVAGVAIEEGHHPDIFISYNKVDITLTTHAIGGLSDNDFIMAAKIEELLIN